MPEGDIPENLRHFIFDHVNSVEQLEVLLFLRQNADRSWTSESISIELRSSPASVSQRLESLISLELVEKNKDGFQYKPFSKELRDLIDQLSDIYRLKRQKIFEIIFSPAKKVKNFSDAFMIGKPPKKGE